MAFGLVVMLSPFAFELFSPFEPLAFPFVVASRYDAPLDVPAAALPLDEDAVAEVALGNELNELRPNPNAFFAVFPSSPGYSPCSCMGPPGGGLAYGLPCWGCRAYMPSGG